MREWAIGTAVTIVSLTAYSGAASASPIIDRNEVARGLVAQADLGRILTRERRVADDRELALITGYTQKIALLNKQLAQTSIAVGRQRVLVANKASEQRAAEAELVKVRADFAKLAETLAKRDAEWALQREAYRAEAQQIADTASPEKLAALQMFADGERIRAWPILQELAEVSVRGSQNAANLKAAVVVRQLSEQREVMRQHGEASVSDVLAIVQRAAALDPKDFLTQIHLSALLLKVGETSKSAEAATRAVGLANDPFKRTIAFQTLSHVEIARNNNSSADKALQRALEEAKSALSAYPTSGAAYCNVVVAYGNLGLRQLVQNDFTGSLDSFKNLIEHFDAMSKLSVYPSDCRTARIETEGNIGDVYRRMGKYDLAASAIEDSIKYEISMGSKDGSDERKNLYLISLYARLADIEIKQNQYSKSRINFDAGIKLAQDMVKSDPRNLDFKRAELPISEMAAEQYFTEKNWTSAIMAFGKTLDKATTYHQEYPNDTVIQQNIYLDHLYIGAAMEESRHLPEAMRNYNAAMVDAAELVRLAPGVTEYQNNLQTAQTIVAKGGRSRQHD